MQKTLTLTAIEPDDDQRLDAAMHATDFILVLSNFLDALRQKYKYGVGPDEAKYAEQFKDELWKEIKDYNLERFFC